MGLSLVIGVKPAHASHGTASAHVVGDVYRLVYHAAAGTLLSPLETAGPYTLKAACSSQSMGTTIFLAETGPKSTDLPSRTEGSDDTPPFHPSVHTFELPAGTHVVVSSTAGSGHFSRVAGSLFLISTRGFLRIDYNAVADARTSNMDCSIYGTATLALTRRPTQGDALGLSFNATAKTAAPAVKLARVGPYQLSAQCLGRGVGGVSFEVFSTGPAGSESVGGIYAGNTIATTPYAYGKPLGANRREIIEGEGLGKGGYRPCEWHHSSPVKAQRGAAGFPGACQYQRTYVRLLRHCNGGPRRLGASRRPAGPDLLQPAQRPEHEDCKVRALHLCGPLRASGPRGRFPHERGRPPHVRQLQLDRRSER